MFCMALKIDDWIGDETGHRRPDTTMLTIMFSVCFFLAATQDVAVDGWSLTMLQKFVYIYYCGCFIL